MEEFRQKLVVDTLHTSTCTSSNVILMESCFGVFKEGIGNSSTVGCDLYEYRSEGFGVHNSTNGPNLQWCNFGGKIASTSTVGHAKSVVQKTHDQLKREQEDAQAATEWEKRHASKRVGNSALRANQLFKRRRCDETGMNNYEADVLNQAVIGNGGAGIRNSSEPKRGQFEAQRVHGFSDIHTKSITGRELSLLELRNILMKKGLLEVRGKLKEWSSNQVGRVTGPSWLDNMTRGKTYLLRGKNGRVSAEASSGHIAYKHLYKFKCQIFQYEVIHMPLCFIGVRELTVPFVLKNEQPGAVEHMTCG
ncbi:hypothetical protein NC652_029096 [Populus alba x Populus x berolinensis]|nr:hypothetical protein NC652_029096 [Populus alba x Populus x berolinensis]